MFKRLGFTAIEFTIAIVILTIIGVVFFTQRSDLQAADRDTQRKIAINAVYYNLVEVVKPALGGYPRVIQGEELKAMDHALLVDPSGKKLGTRDSSYRYEPTECNGGDICKSFILRAILEREDMLTKRSPL